MNDVLFVIIALSATFAFLVGVVAGTWSTLLLSLGIGIGLLWLINRLP